MSQIARYYKKLSALEQEVENYEAAFDYMLAHIATQSGITSRFSEDRLHALHIKNRVEQLHREAQLERLRNIELAEINKRLEDLNIEINNLLGIAANNLKNPLASIKLSADFLLRHADALSTENIKEFASDLLKTSAYMFQVITNLLKINALESGKVNSEISPTDAVSLTRFVLESFREQIENKNIAVNLYSDDIPKVLVDERHLRDVLENLISNAVKFSYFNQRIDVAFRAFDNSFVRITIRDFGPGISEEDMPKLFKKFQKLSSRPTGGEDSSGLGLSIAEKLVKLMNGRVWFEPAEGKGAAFIVELPCE